MNKDSGYIDLFIETDSTAARNPGAESSYHNDITDYLPEELSRFYWSNTPPIKLPNNRLLFYTRLSTREASYKDHLSLISDFIKGRSWRELWEGPYEFRDHVFKVNILRDLDIDGNNVPSQISIPMADLKFGEFPTELLARPPGVFFGDEVEEFSITPKDLNISSEIWEKELNHKMLARLDELEELIRLRIPARGGIGHNQPPEPLDDELPAEVNLDDLLEAVADARHEGNATTPDLQKSEQVARRFRQWAIGIERWVTDRVNAQIDNVVTGLLAGTTILWAHDIVASLMAAAKAINDWVSALSFPF